MKYYIFDEVSAVDKYEYKLKTEEMLELMEDGSYRKAAEIADMIDWKRVRNVMMLTNVSDIYEKNKEYQKSYEVLEAAYHRAEGSRKVLYRLCTLALKTGNVDEAIDYYDEFVQIAPKDPNQHILRYQIFRAQRSPIEQQIEALEEFKKAEYIEEWAYELAKLYQEAGMTAECLEECDDLILWFSEGQYVYKAMELKMQYKPLTPSQQEKYDHRYEKPSAETEEMPDLAAYASGKNAGSEEGAAVEKDTEDESKAADAADKEETEDSGTISEDSGNKNAAEKEDISENGVEVSGESAAGMVSGRIAAGADSIKKKKIGDTMRLDEALQKLLHPEKSADKSEDSSEEPVSNEVEEEPDITDLEGAIDEIESVVDLDMVNRLAEEKKASVKTAKKAKLSGGMTELIPDDDVGSAELEADAAEESDGEIGFAGAEELTGEIDLAGAEELTGEIDLAGAEELTGEIDLAGAEELTGEIDLAGAEELTGEIDLAETEEPGEEIDLAEAEEPGEEIDLAGAEELTGEIDFTEAEAGSAGLEEAEEVDLDEAEDFLAGEEGDETAIEKEDESINADDQITGQMTLADILSGWEESVSVREETSEEDENIELTEEISATEESIGLAEADPRQAEETAKIEESTDSEGEEESNIDNNLPEGENIGEQRMEDKKKTEPILPPDIQRLIDEIEGVIPPQEEEKPKHTLNREEVPRENMGKVTEELRIDDELEEDEEFWDEEDWDEEELIEDFGDGEDYMEDTSEDWEDEEEDILEDEEDYEELEEYDDVLEDGEEYDDVLEDGEEYEDVLEDGEEYEDVLEDGEEYEDVLEDGEEYEEDYEETYEEEAEPDTEDEQEMTDFHDDMEDTGEMPDFEEEFRVDPKHSEEPDDREIPDDNDEGMDILSATTPLSRKETAKMIATGKTAPLPLDEISDALSMSDTGFIVHGRYDLEMQSGIGTRAGLTEEQKKLFSYFVPVRGMSEQLVDVLEQDKNCTNRGGTSRTGNLLIIGNKGNGKTVLAVDVVKAIQKQRNIRQGKVAIVTGESLNKKKISDIFDKLYGGALIVEKAGKLNEKTVARLNKAMEKDTGELLIVLEEQRKPLDRLLSSNREFRRKFTCRLEVPLFINDELVTFGQTYAQENGYRIDEMGILALYSRIDSLQREDHAVTVAEVKEIMDSAIAHSQKASAKKLVKRVFGRNTDDADRILLSEKDFNI